MDVADVRRLVGTSLVVGVVAIAWLIFLALDDANLFNWSWPTRGLELITLPTWMWVVAGTLFVVLAGVASAVFGITVQSGDKAPTRQVQCQNCKAVFFVPDNGRRPLMHVCPSCQALGVYDGKAPAVGEAPKVVPPQRVIQIPLTCRTCAFKFNATDIGVRPLRIECPNCKAVGNLR